MKGYEILEQKYLQPYKEDGVKPNAIKIGVPDFLREVKPTFSLYNPAQLYYSNCNADRSLTWADRDIICNFS